MDRWMCLVDDENDESSFDFYRLLWLNGFWLGRRRRLLLLLLLLPTVVYA